MIPKRGTIYKGANLEAWVQNQKLRYKIKIGLSKKRQVKAMSDEELLKLKKINFPFEDLYEDIWMQNYNVYKKII